jgi:DNA-binding FadR family transcriptional regulator
MSVEHRLRELIATGASKGRYGPGAKLPTERELVELLGAPRSAIRQGLAALERDQLVVRHVGRGTFVAEDATHGRLRAPADTSPTEIMQVRSLLEPQIARLAAQVARQADLDHIDRCLHRGGAATDHAGFEAWDAELHRAIAKAARNTLLLTLFDTMNAARDLPVWGSLKKRSFSPQRRLAYHQDHAAIVAALHDRDPEAAGHAMARHLRHVTDNLLGSLHSGVPAGG